MKIDINNYEAFFLDFVEGRLDDASTLEMLAFLRKNPDLKAELENFSDIRLEPAEIAYEHKEVLKKLEFNVPEVGIRNFDDFCIAYYEKLLTKTEEEKLFAYLAQFPDKKRDFELFGKATLKADPAVVFEAKPFLKKKVKGAVRTIILRWSAVAAGVVLLVSVYYLSPDKDQPKIQHGTTVAAKEIIQDSKTNFADNKTIKITPQKGKISDTAKPIVLNSPVVESIAPEEESVALQAEMLPLLKPIPANSIEVSESPKPELLTSTEYISQNIVEEEFEVLDYAEKMFREKVLKTDENKPKKKLSLWDLADITLKGYNTIAEKDIVLHRKTDENGKLTAIAIETENKKYGFETKN